MKAAVFTAPGKTTICGTDVHILKGERRVAPGRIVGHEPVGVIDSLGAGVAGYSIGQRVIVGAITPCGQCHSCPDGHHAQCGGKAMGGWRFGNTIDGAQAEYPSPSARSRPSRAACGCSSPAGCSRALACTPENYRCRPTRSPRGWAITAS